MSESTPSNFPSDLEAFRAIIERDIAPALQAREGERRQVTRTAIQSVVGAVAVVVFGGVGLGLFALKLPQVLVAAIVIAVGIGAVGTSPLRRLTREMKAIMVTPIANGLGLSFTPDPGHVEGIGYHRRLKLIPSYDRSRFEDRLVGQRHNIDFEFFEATLKQRRTSTSNGRTRTRYVTVFRGQCLRFDFHKRFFGETVITRDAGFFNRFGGRKGMDRARLEDPDFEKAFEVYTTDQVEARFLLTPDMMQALVDLEQLFNGKNLRCAFSGEDMLIAVEGENLFEPHSPFKAFDDPERTNRLLRDFAAVFTLIDVASQRRDAEESGRGALD